MMHVQCRNASSHFSSQTLLMCIDVWCAFCTADTITEVLDLALFQTLRLYFQNQFLSHSWLRCHWSHGGHTPPSRVVRQPPPTEKWSFLDWRGIWTEIAWHHHLFGSGEYGQTATRWLLRGRARTVARSDWTLIPHRCRKAGIPDLQQFVNMFSWPWRPRGFNGSSIIMNIFSYLSGHLDISEGQLSHLKL